MDPQPAAPPPAHGDARYGGDLQGRARHGGVPLLRAVRRLDAAAFAAAAACVCLFSASCRSADDKAREERQSASSWCATLRESALDLRSRRIPSRFARDTFRQAREELSDELS